MTRILSVVLICYFWLHLAHGDGGDVDLTLKSRATGSLVVEAVVAEIEESCIFNDDRLLLRRIARAGTLDGTEEHTFVDVNTKNNYYGGIWQVTEDMFRFVKSNSDAFKDRINETFSIQWDDVYWQDMWIPLHNGLAARIWIELTLTRIPRSEEDQAKFWSELYQPLERATKFNVRIRSIETGCSSYRADIIFAIDGSKSVQPESFDLTQAFLMSMVESFNIGPDQVRIGLIQYDNFATVEITLGEHNDQNTIVEKIGEVSQLAGGTETAAALTEMKTMFENHRRSSSGGKVPQIGILFTDGVSNSRKRTAKSAEEIRAAGVEMFAVGIGEGVPDNTELNSIGSLPNCTHVFLLDTFQSMTHFERQLTELACNAHADIENTTESAISYGDRIYYKTEVTTAGVTITLEAYSGEIDLFVSWETRQPSEARYLKRGSVNAAGQDIVDLFIPHKPHVSRGDTDSVTRDRWLYITLVGAGLEGQRSTFLMTFTDGNPLGITEPASTTTTSTTTTTTSTTTTQPGNKKQMTTETDNFAQTPLASNAVTPHLKIAVLGYIVFSLLLR